MSLKLKLKPRERIVIAGALITNGSSTAEIVIENKVPLLREKEIMRAEEVTSVCREIYFMIQLMYFDRENLQQHHQSYWKIVRKLINAAPSAIGYISVISELLLEEKYYQALKQARKLVAYESEIISHAQQSA